MLARRFTTAAQSLRAPFFIPRNANGNLPVYSDVRNGGTRLQVSIRNVDGNVSELAKELSSTLFQPGTKEAQRLKIRTNHAHIVISGGRWSREVVEWLKARGF